MELSYGAEKVFFGVCVFVFSSSGFIPYFSFSPFQDSCCGIALSFSALLVMT